MGHTETILRMRLLINNRKGAKRSCVSVSHTWKQLMGQNSVAPARARSLRRTSSWTEGVLPGTRGLGTAGLWKPHARHSHPGPRPGLCTMDPWTSTAASDQLHRAVKLCALALLRAFRKPQPHIANGMKGNGTLETEKENSTQTKPIHYPVSLRTFFFSRYFKDPTSATTELPHAILQNNMPSKRLMPEFALCIAVERHFWCLRPSTLLLQGVSLT